MLLDKRRSEGPSESVDRPPFPSQPLRVSTFLFSTRLQLRHVLGNRTACYLKTKGSLHARSSFISEKRFARIYNSPRHRKNCKTNPFIAPNSNKKRLLPLGSKRTQRVPLPPSQRKPGSVQDVFCMLPSEGSANPAST